MADNLTPTVWSAETNNERREKVKLMRNGHCIDRIRQVFWLPVLIGTFLTVCGTAGCSYTPKLTAQDKKQDIQFLADWARDYDPFIELNEKYKNTPNFETLLPRYLEFAENARNDEEFLQVVKGYFNVIGATGHYYLVDEETLKYAGLGSLLGIIKLGITPGQFDRARYWARLSQKISTRAHPPFHIVYREGRYFTDDEWQYEGKTIPPGSELLKIDGMTCPAYLDFLNENTPLRYDAYPKDWTKQYLLIIDEGPVHKGWQVDFSLPDGSTLNAFVPKIEGYPAPRKEPVHTVEPKANCTCLELADDVGYVRIRAFMGGLKSYLFRGFIKKDRKKISSFLKHSEGRYGKLIIDIRNNYGGLPQYFYDVLISPFLDEPATYSQVVGLKKKYLADTDNSVLQFLKKDISTQKTHVINVTETQPPTELDPNLWTFYELIRRIKPRNRYDFKGDIYILINGGCFSAADDYVNAVKRIGFAKLVGRNTSGGAACYVAPPIVILPASGMAFRVETDLVVNPDGSFDEISGTPPDIELPKAEPPASITKQDLLKDAWIQKIINDL
jgi:hypothetical protein